MPRPASRGLEDRAILGVTGYRNPTHLGHLPRLSAFGCLHHQCQDGANHHPHVWIGARERTDAHRKDPVGQDGLHQAKGGGRALLCRRPSSFTATDKPASAAPLRPHANACWLPQRGISRGSRWFCKPVWGSRAKQPSPLPEIPKSPSVQ